MFTAVSTEPSPVSGTQTPLRKEMHQKLGPEFLPDLLLGTGSRGLPKSALDRASSLTASAALCGFGGSAQARTPCLKKLTVKPLVPERRTGGVSGQGCDRRDVAL